MWYDKAFKQGYPKAQVRLGDCRYLKGGIGGRGRGRYYVEAVMWYQKAAQKDNAEAQTRLGICYEEGIDVDKNLKEAVMWYQKAAEMGHAEAQRRLEICYKEGIGGNKNPKEAAMWHQKAVWKHQAHTSSSAFEDLLMYEGILNW